MSTTAQDVQAAIQKPQQPENNPWPERLEAFKKFSDKFHERGSKIEQRYEDERDVNQGDTGAQPGDKRVNMFYSNVTVIKESLYNSLPKPTVSRLHTGEWDNEAARVAATIVERGLAYEVACAPSFDASVKAAILDRLVPGMGTLWVNFVPAEGNNPESMTVDMVYWKDLIYEPQRAWEMVTWVGRKLHVDKETARKRWGEAALSSPPRKNATSTTVEDAMNEGKVCVIQMWDKNTKSVIHMTTDGTVLTTTPDPYQLKNFFPTPRPLIASPPTRKFLPMIDYYMAQDQYMEMDVLYARINLIIEAVKVAGVYDSSVPEIARMLSGTENKLIPVDNWAMFAEKGGAKGVIDWFPVEQITQVLQHLVTTYEFIKTQLFEVTGMADIVRGSTNQYETAAAQQIKAQFASVRMNGFQRDVATFVRDTIRIMAEIMVQMYTDQKMIQIVGQLSEADQPYVPAAAAILRNDFTLYYNVSIQTDSLTQADWGLQQEQRMSYAQTLSQFLQSALPVAQSMPELSPLLVQIIKFMSVGFKGSSELEGVLDSVLQQLQQAPAEEEPAPPDPAVVKAEMEIKGLQQKQQIEQQNAALKQQQMTAELQHKRAMQEAELEFKRVSHAMELEHESRLFTMKQQQEAIHNVIENAQNQHRFQNEQNRKNDEHEANRRHKEEGNAIDLAHTATKAASKKEKGNASEE